MSTEIIPFEFEGAPVRGIRIDGEPWAVLADVCRVLDIANSRDAARRLDDDEKGVVNTDTPSGIQQMTIVNESGLYNLIFRSRKPQAKRFRKWVTAEVLPAIRKTGRYEAPRAPQPVEESPLVTLTAHQYTAVLSRLIEVQDKLIARQDHIARLEAEEKRLAHAFADLLVVETALSDEEIAHHLKGVWKGSHMPEWVAWRRRKVKEASVGGAAGAAP